MYHFADLAAAEAALEQFIPAQMPRPAYTLEHVSAFMEYINNPQDTVKAIHIAGTSGKTSSAYYAAALLQVSGKKVGLLTSPHVESITERVQVNLTPLDDDLFCSELATFMNIVEDSTIQLSYAELLYAFAFWEFARLGLDYTVIETGLGGLLDATNVISREDKVCVITDISLDHTNILGNTLEAIASQKAGIIQLHNTVFSYRQDPIVMAAFQKECRQRQASLHIIDAPGPAAPTAPLHFLPLFQQRNFGLVLEAVAYVVERDDLPELSDAAVLQAAHTHIPGRMEELRRGQQVIVLDGAHNPQKLQTLRESVAERYPGQPVAAMVSFIKGGGRSLTAMLRELAPPYTHIIATVPSEAGRHAWYTPEEISQAARQAGITSLEIITNYNQACQSLLQRPEPVLVVTGSLYALAPMWHYLHSVE